MANPAASIRIPSATAKSNGKGEIEDRRPASNIDPYVVAALITDSSILKLSKFGELLDHF